LSAPSVGLFTYSTLPRGSVVHTTYLAEALHDEGCDVTVYALDKDGRGMFRPLRVRLVLVPAAPTPASTADLVRTRARELREHLTRTAPRHDVYHAQDCLTANALIDLRVEGRRIDVVRTVHHVESFADPFLAACQERSIREAALCLAVSADARRSVSMLFGVDALPVSNGVSLSRFSRVENDRIAALRERFGAGTGPVILAVGGVEDRKNTIHTLRAFARVRERHPGARFWILGGATVLDHGAYRARFDRALLELPPSTRAAVTELGVVDDDDVPALFRTADALVFASVHEGFGLAALEALAADLPLVASRCPPMTEFLDDDCATLVDPSSDESIAKGIVIALDRVAVMAKCLAGRRRAAAYSWERVALAHIDAYSLLTRRPAAGAA
jgi:glycosyltransferase-like protein